MNCQHETPQRIQELIAAEIASYPLYIPAKNSVTTPVTFHFNLYPEILGETLFTIESNKVSQIVYRGPFQRKIVIQADEELLKDKGVDSLSFVFFKMKSNEVCVAEQDDGGWRYWQLGVNAHIEFLAHRELSEYTGLPIDYKVRIE